MTIHIIQYIIYAENNGPDEKEIFMSIYVKSEIAPLKRVMLHRPGQELEHLTPNTLDRLLFDDIPYLEVA